MSNDTLAANIEGLLFALGRPLSRPELREIFSVAPEKLEEAIAHLREKQGGIVLVDDGTFVELRAGPEVAKSIEQIRFEENSREIGRAGLEVLAAILYRGPLSRSEIDFVRGVNSSQTLRTLTTRGLIRRREGDRGSDASQGGRSTPIYEPTTELLSSIGATHPRDLPDFDAVRSKLSQLEEQYRSVAERQL